MTKLGLLATASALIAFSLLVMAPSNTGSVSNGGGIMLAQNELRIGNPPDPNYEQPDTMPTYQKNDGTDKAD